MAAPPRAPEPGLAARPRPGRRACPARPGGNALTGAPLLSRPAAAAAGIDAPEIPRLADRTLRQWFARRGDGPYGDGPYGDGTRGTVLPPARRADGHPGRAAHRPLPGLPVARLRRDTVAALAQVHCHQHAVLVYASGGFTNHTLDDLRTWLGTWVGTRGIPRVKIKIGAGWGGNVDRDLERVAAARAVVGDDAELYVDANGAYGPAQARRVARRLEHHDVRWFEEPVSSDDLTGRAELRRATTIDIAAGEYGYDLPYFARMIDAGAVDCLQVDVTRCGGYAEWQGIAAVAAAANREVSAHCAPNLSAHVAAATPNFRHIEWFADHDRVETALFDGTLDPTGGHVMPVLGTPGHGLALKTGD